MSQEFSQDFFTLFGLPRRFGIDAAQLDAAWRAAAAQVHPDRYAASPDAEKRSALMLATRVNEAYQTLKSPLNRARYLLLLSGVDTQEENNTRMPGDFLMAQMEWRESIDDARRSVDELETLSGRLRAEVKSMQQALAAALDAEADLDAAAVWVRKLRFMEKLDQEIGDAIESLLD
ncbi:Fe-S protein assembly co-chaperone HscB [Chromobacterium sp. IIBBL 290-4]|uniref:Fe-S protein assembly co-chaperone HscB n=1 Tax=Chromobacterium sp. IIBBL 290-4 TaxID=2953890 RepID=UPI0020B6C828|nr:Fe-S protein assembly co-chaperone HscB [Chromobacterium sp. IIBBL 290-4]UTH74962.1 Fe-S protein assembly co-chaperone HscB [Chromobacterium sp. IIBBL 290-4]